MSSTLSSSGEPMTHQPGAHRSGTDRWLDLSARTSSWPFSSASSQASRAEPSGVARASRRHYSCSSDGYCPEASIKCFMISDEALNPAAQHIADVFATTAKLPPDDPGCWQWREPDWLWRAASRTAPGHRGRRGVGLRLSGIWLFHEEHAIPTKLQQLRGRRPRAVHAVLRGSAVLERRDPAISTARSRSEPSGERVAGLELGEQPSRLPPRGRRG
jgi:hypothetical protein